jgi:hypothetical protein
MRNMVQCEKCGNWYSYKSECGCDTRIDPRKEFLNKYNIKNGDEVEFIDGLVTKFDSYSFGQGSSFLVDSEKTIPQRNFMMVHINQVVDDLGKYRVVRVNEHVF